MKAGALNIGGDVRLLEWLLSNPVAEVYSTNVPVMIVSYETTRTTRKGKTVPDASGIRRWPMVPDRPTG